MIEKDALSPQMARQFAYQDEADPLFFQWQRGESTEAIWLDKIQEIKDRYPLD